MNVQHIPNHEKKAFRDMTPEEMGAIAAAIINGEIEYWSSYSRKWMTPGRAMGGLDFEAAYRTRQRKLEIPWEHIRPEYKWAELQGRVVWLYKNDPKTCYVDDLGAVPLLGLDIKIDGITASESLTPRPEGV